MLVLRRNEQRQHIHRGSHHIWQTLYPDSNIDSYGLLAAFSEIWLPPGVGTTLRTSSNLEVITYVQKGKLAQEDKATGSWIPLLAGEVQRMTVSAGSHPNETNGSHVDWVHFFRISLQPAKKATAAPGKQLYTVAQRRNVLRAVTSPDGREGSLKSGQDAVIYSSIPDLGHHLVHELQPSRKAWLHVVCGELTFGETILTQGDSAGIENESRISLTFHESSEILLLDMGPGSI